MNDYAQAAADPHASINGYVIEGENSAGVHTRAIGSPIQMSATPTRPSVEAPELGQHTEEVFLEIGIDWDRIAALRESGAI